MKIIKQTLEFTEWLDGLKDNVTRLRLTARLKKAKLGNLGDIKPVGEGVWEMREFFGAGWRMYYIQEGDIILLMLGGGDKSSQQKDIAKALPYPNSFRSKLCTKYPSYQSLINAKRERHRHRHKRQPKANSMNT